MNTENQVYNCPNCGGQLAWSPELQKLKCPYCDSEYDISDFEKKEDKVEDSLKEKNYQQGRNAADEGFSEATDDSNINPEDLRVYQCSMCGAEIVTDKTTVATTCAFCQNPVVLTEQLDTKFKPKYIIPFQVEQGRVEEIYRKYVSSRPLVPGALKSDATIEKIKAIYIPFWMYNMNMQGELTASGERLLTTQDSRFIYTTHQVYRIERGGEAMIRNLPVDGSSKTPDDAMDSIEPFDFSQLRPFKLPYLTGFMAERYDQDAGMCYQRARDRADQSISDELHRSIGGYATLRVQNQKIFEKGPMDASYALLPVYLLSTEYRGKQQIFAINGQTGKIAGNVPVSAGKAAGIFSGIFAAVFAVVLVLISFVL